MSAQKPAPDPKRGRRRDGPMSGRQAEAARNDQLILESARAVFVNDPGAPITAVAKHAGVGISALYTRYGSKDELLRQLCTDGLRIVVQETEVALERIEAGHEDPWVVFADFMRRLTDADTSSMTRALAGRFAPTPEMFALASRSAELMDELFALVRDVLRPDLALHDISLSFELVAAIKFADPERTTELRHRYLALMLDGMRATGRGDLPGPPPGWKELSERWARE